MKISKFNRALKIIAIIGALALIADTAFAQNRQNNNGRNHRQYNNPSSGGGSWWQSLNPRHREAVQNWRSRITTQIQDRRRPTSGVPEPSAALLFATGGLIVAHSLRNKRKKQN